MSILEPLSPSQPRVPTAAWLAVLALLVGLLAPDAAAAGPKERLEETEARIERTIAELDALEGDVDSSEAAVEQARAKAAELEDALNEALAALEEQRVRVRQAEQQVLEAQAEIDRIRGNVSRRARDIFKGELPPVVQLVRSDGDLAGTLDGVTLLARLASRDRADLESLGAAEVSAAAAADRFEAETAALAEVRERREALLTEAEAALAAREDALADLVDQRERLLAQQEELEEEQESIESLIAAEAARQRAPARTSAPAPAPPPSSGSCYAWPARGAVTSEYGPRWGRMHAGLDIDGNTGDPLYAAESGVVIFAGWQGGYGRLTLIQHGDGVVTAYAHQSSFGVGHGQSVSRGEFIGRMGTSGNVTGSHLHFETRVGGSAVNPRRYLC
jgi:murein DD-endopeptidase MepM/ murein hydrolase activator NlpD